MFLIKVNFTLENTFRKGAIRGDSYRPIFFFSNNLNRSGLIVLDEGEELEMTGLYENRLVKIYFHKDIDPHKEFYVGRKFIMAEGSPRIGKIGEGVITDIVGEE
jgi:hypothetical protein